jgi:hypothetical protein
MLRALFIHPPKTGGSSVRRLLGKWGDRTCPITHYAHYTVTGLLYAGVLTRQEIENATTFATIRNPWSRLVSGYFASRAHRSPDVNAMFRDLTFQAFAEWAISGKLPMMRKGGSKHGQFAHPQVRWLFVDGYQVVGHLLRMEHLAKDWKAFRGKIGINKEMMHVNRSEHAHYRTYYDAKLAQRVGDFYHHDLALGNYDF